MQRDAKGFLWPLFHGLKPHGYHRDVAPRLAEWGI